MDQKVIFRAMLGWQVGILVGMFGAMIAMWFFSMNIWLKIFSTIGLFSASLGTFYSITQTWLQYKAYLEMMKGNNNYLNNIKEQLKGGSKDETIQR